MAHLRSLFIKELFDRFDYNLDFQVPDGGGIKIITAPNGYGKSTVLNLVADVLAGRYERVAQTPFVELRLVVDSGKVLSIDRWDESDGTLPKLGYAFYKNEKQKKASATWFWDSEEQSSERTIEWGGRTYSHNGRVWTDQSNRPAMPYLQRRFNSLASETDQPRKRPSNEPPWLTEFYRDYKVTFITADRLALGQEAEFDRQGHPITAIESEAMAVAEEIQELRARYEQTARGLESTFPKRILNALAEDLGKQGYLEKLEELKKYTDTISREQQIIELGILSELDVSRGDFFKDLTAHPSAVVVLLEYFKDFDARLKAIEDGVKRLSLFVDTLNKMLLRKIVRIDIEEGITITSTRKPLVDMPDPSPRVGNDGEVLGADIKLSNLSSGEQHLVVLLSRIILQTQEGAVTLLDEPEISLHPQWQVDFTKLLSEAIDLNRSQVILATHSPALIDDRWDDVIELWQP